MYPSLILCYLHSVIAFYCVTLAASQLVPYLEDSYGRVIKRQGYGILKLG